MQQLEAIAEQVRKGRLDEARKALKEVRENEDNKAELRFIEGYIKEMNFDRDDAVESYQRLIKDHPEHMDATFHLARLADQAGDDDLAISLYEICASGGRPHANAMLNLAVLYEDRGRLSMAEQLVRRVINDYPNHMRARSLLESIENSYHMKYDERSLKDRDQQTAMLDTPITDFELSVRSRNCLKQMNLHTLGDLLKVSEAELLSYKNFGETSLNELKILLTAKNLRLGMMIQPPPEKPLRSVSLQPSGDGAANLNKPVSEMELSVRARKCLQWLGVSTLGELAMRSESELLAIKNFGQTSLQEIKRQLQLFGLSLR